MLKPNPKHTLRPLSVAPTMDQLHNESLTQLVASGRFDGLGEHLLDVFQTEGDTLLRYVSRSLVEALQTLEAAAAAITDPTNEPLPLKNAFSLLPLSEDKDGLYLPQENNCVWYTGGVSNVVMSSNQFQYWRVREDKMKPGDDCRRLSLEELRKRLARPRSVKFDRVLFDAYSAAKNGVRILSWHAQIRKNVPVLSDMFDDPVDEKYYRHSLEAATLLVIPLARTFTMIDSITELIRAYTKHIDPDYDQDSIAVGANDITLAMIHADDFTYIKHMHDAMFNLDSAPRELIKHVSFHVHMTQILDRRRLLKSGSYTKSLTERVFDDSICRCRPRGDKFFTEELTRATPPDMQTSTETYYAALARIPHYVHGVIELSECEWPLLHADILDAGDEHFVYGYLVYRVRTRRSTTALDPISLIECPLDETVIASTTHVDRFSAVSSYMPMSFTGDLETSLPEYLSRQASGRSVCVIVRLPRDTERCILMHQHLKEVTSPIEALRERLGSNETLRRNIEAAYAGDIDATHIAPLMWSTAHYGCLTTVMYPGDPATAKWHLRDIRGFSCTHAGMDRHIAEQFDESALEYFNEITDAATGRALWHPMSQYDLPHQYPAGTYHSSYGARTFPLQLDDEGVGASGVLPVWTESSSAPLREILSLCRGYIAADTNVCFYKVDIVIAILKTHKFAAQKRSNVSDTNPISLRYSYYRVLRPT